jgi:hypothetical protein
MRGLRGGEGGGACVEEGEGAHVGVERGGAFPGAAYGVDGAGECG